MYIYITKRYNTGAAWELNWHSFIALNHNIIKQNNIIVATILVTY